MKNIIIICLFTFGLAACNTDTKKEEKIDFTKSYETAALALTDAQLNYDAAVASKDVTRIAAAKIQLETAKTNYLNSKTYYTANGGIVKAEDDQLLAKANISLGKPAKDTTTVAAAAEKFIDSTKVNADKKAKQVISAIATGESKVKQVSDAVAVGQTTVKNNVVKANEGLKKANDSTKKRLDEIKKQGNDLLNLFKRKADTTKNN
jgi:hypothetical protein